ncbi:hypothetical protein [Halotia branconii]|uniref:Uncharacterized protein n=1 Tax=Halotia branconii CENA392 TaxID=1539056 RepID=A0AAJ6PA45_9CYAN|nr:hypothetical protein [Halotia branconii]WGV26489.1 hypothetical protein QI031_02975 [Halotia branconii CENA392]
MKRTRRSSRKLNLIPFHFKVDTFGQAGEAVRSWGFPPGASNCRGAGEAEEAGEAGEAGEAALRLRGS